MTFQLDQIRFDRFGEKKTFQLFVRLSVRHDAQRNVHSTAIFPLDFVHVEAVRLIDQLVNRRGFLLRFVVQRLQSAALFRPGEHFVRDVNSFPNETKRKREEENERKGDAHAKVGGVLYIEPFAS